MHVASMFMRLVSWNMACAFEFAGTHNQAWETLLDLDPDIALLQEARPPPWLPADRLAAWSRAYPTKAWGSAILIKPGARSRRAEAPTARWLSTLEGKIVTAIVEVEGTETLVASLHAPAWPAPSELLDGFDLTGVKLELNSQVWMLDLMFDDLKRVSGERRFIVGGDLKAALLFDINYGPSGNAEFFERTRTAGWVDVRERFHPEEQQTFFKMGRGPYQLDHIFVDALTAESLKEFEILVGDSWLALSDHAPIVVDW